MKFLVFLIPVALLAGIAWLARELLQMLAKVEFAFVRYRDGILVLERKTRLTTEEVQFSPTETFRDLGPKQLAEHSGGATWYTWPEGFEVGKKSTEAKAIERCLRMAGNTGLLEAERDTDV